MSNWNDVKDCMPLDGIIDPKIKTIECIVSDGKSVFSAHYSIGGYDTGKRWGSWSEPYAKITHWQYLPQAPEK